MSNSYFNIQDFFESRARDGNGMFAIAYALMELAGQQKLVARAIDAARMNNMKPDGAPGASAVRGLLEAHPDISALYNVAGGKQGLVRALQEIGRDRKSVV